MDMKTENKTPALTESSALCDVLQHFDSKTALAKALGLTRQAITNMDMSAPLSRVHYLTLRYEKSVGLYLHEDSAA